MRLSAWLAFAAAIFTPALAEARDTTVPPGRLQVHPKAAEFQVVARRLATAPDATAPAPAASQAETDDQSDPSAPQSAEDPKPDETQTAFSTGPETEYDGYRSALPADWGHGFSMGPNISTLGLGAEMGYRFNDHFGLRIVGNYYSDRLSRQTNRSKYDADFTMLSTGAVADIYPFGNFFRVSGGMRFNGNSADLEVTPTVDTGGQAVQLDGNVQFRKYAPYAGIGFQGRSADGRLAMAADFGVLFQGMPDVHLEGRGPLASHPRFQSEVDREIENIEGDLAIIAYYPVVRFSMTYRF